MRIEERKYLGEVIVLDPREHIRVSDGSDSSWSIVMDTDGSLRINYDGRGAKYAIAVKPMSSNVVTLVPSVP